MVSSVYFYFFRHGETDYNALKLIQGQCDRSSLEGVGDANLNEKGKKQAALIAEMFQRNNISLNVILTSPLNRAKETAEIIAHHLNVETIQDKRLKEMFFGADYEGMPVAEFKKLFFTPSISLYDDGRLLAVISNGKTLRELHKDTDPKWNNLAHPGGETKKQVQERALEAISDFLLHHSYHQHIGVCAHNALLRFLLTIIAPAEAIISVTHTDIITVSYELSTKKWRFINRIKKDSFLSDNQ